MHSNTYVCAVVGYGVGMTMTASNDQAAAAAGNDDGQAPAPLYALETYFVDIAQGKLIRTGSLELDSSVASSVNALPVHMLCLQLANPEARL